MASPTTRAEFRENCLRRLGKPVIEINVDEDQVEDRVDEALRYYWDYHFDGSSKTYYKYQVTEQDKINQYVTIPENIIGVVNIFDLGSALGTNNLFNIRYQIALNDLYTLTSVSMVPYYMAMQHIQFLEFLLVGKQPLRYNRNTNRLYIDMDWDRINGGEFLVVEAYEVVDPDLYVDVWKDRWLLRYAACLIKQQWGTNLKKFEGMKMPGGLSFNGQQIYNEATDEREKLEQEMIYTYSLPATDMIG
ncbi:MAG: hypothetical protein [Caudoviricetes sp.]|nr:MAG: hypothetical protein [Caudoviricetes sp.]